jgi:hypothetical protein
MFDLDTLEQAERALRAMRPGDALPAPGSAPRAEPPRCPFHHAERQDQAA